MHDEPHASEHGERWKKLWAEQGEGEKRQPGQGGGQAPSPPDATLDDERVDGEASQIAGED